jgi:VCBS repeat protein
MRVLALFASLLVLSVAALGSSGTVNFNFISDTISVPGLPGGVVLADFNRDGIPDVAYTVLGCCGGGGLLVVKLGTGGGSFGPDVQYGPSEPDLDDPVAVDVDGDGWLDIVARSQSDVEFIVMGNNRDGTFHQLSAFPVGGFPGSYAMGDFNHDALIDLAVITCDSPNANWPFSTGSCTLISELGDGSGTFTPSQSIALAGPSYGLQAADISGDGNLDLVYTRASLGVIRFGNGDGTFSVQTYLKPSTTDPVVAATVADFNHDSLLDVALLSGRPCHPTCNAGGPNTVWMYTYLGGTSFVLKSSSQLAADAGNLVTADLNGDLNTDVIYYNHFALGIPPVLAGLGQNGTFLAYGLGQGNATLGQTGTLPDNYYDVAVAFRDLDADSRADYVVLDANELVLGTGIQTGGWKNCPPPNSANLAAQICGISDGQTVSSPLLVKGSGNSPAGVNQLQVWIDYKKQYVKWGDQLSKKFTLSSGTHRISVVANDKFMGSAKSVVNVTVP